MSQSRTLMFSTGQAPGTALTERRLPLVVPLLPADHRRFRRLSFRDVASCCRELGLCTSRRGPAQPNPNPRGYCWGSHPLRELTLGAESRVGMHWTGCLEYLLGTTAYDFGEPVLAEYRIPAVGRSWVQQLVSGGMQHGRTCIGTPNRFHISMSNHAVHDARSTPG